MRHTKSIFLEVVAGKALATIGGEVQSCIQEALLKTPSWSTVWEAALPFWDG